MTSSHGAVIKDSKIKFGNAFGNPINFLKDTVHKVYYLSKETKKKRKIQIKLIKISKFFKED